MKVEARVISQGRRPRLITLAETLIIPHIRKNQIQLLFYYTLFHGKYTKTIV